MGKYMQDQVASRKWRALLSASAVLLSACASPPAAEQVVRIGHVGPTSGAIGYLGRDNQNGAILAVEELNAKRLVIGGRTVRFELVAKDDAADPRRGVAAAQELVAEKISAVVGHLNSGTSIPASLIYSDAGIPQITPSATNPRLTRMGRKTVFRMVADDAKLASRLAEYVGQQRNPRTVVVVDDRTAYGQGVADTFEGVLRAAGSDTRARQFTSDRPSSDAIAALADRIKDARPDVIFYGGMDTVAGPLLRALRARAVHALFVGGDGICSGELPKPVTESLGDVLCAEAGDIGPQATGRMAAFHNKFKQRFSVDVMVYAPYVYDAVHVLADAMQRAGSTEPARVTEALRSTQYDGITGRISFDAKGDVIDGAISLYAYPNNKRALIGVIR